jgi:hypothetical protein
VDYIAECIEIGVEPLEETGAISWVKRYFTGMDASIPAELEKTLGTITTVERKKAALDQLDAYIHAARDIGKQEANAAIYSGPLVFPKMIQATFKHYNVEERKAYKEKLRGLRSKVTAIKVGK